MRGTRGCKGGGVKLQVLALGHTCNNNTCIEQWLCLGIAARPASHRTALESRPCGDCVSYRSAPVQQFSLQMDVRIRVQHLRPGCICRQQYHAWQDVLPLCGSQAFTLPYTVTQQLSIERRQHVL